MTDTSNEGRSMPPETETQQGPATATAPPPPPPPPGSTGVSPVVPEPPGKHRSSGVGFATALIFIGVLLLIAQVVPGLSWWGLWPLIIVAAGVVQAVTPGKEGWNVYRFFDGLVTVAFGLVFLAITMGIIGWSVWWTILGLWPVLLIAIGFDLLGKSLKSSWLRVIGSLAIIAALAYAVAVNAGELQGITFMTIGDTQEVAVSEEVGSTKTADLKLNAGVAQLTIESGSELVTIDGSTPFGEPEVTVERSGNSADVTVNLGDADGVVAWPGSTDADIDMTLSDEVVWDAEFETGLSTVRADLSDVRVRSLLLKPGITDCSVTLGDAPDGEEGRIAVKAGISSVKLRLPSDAEVRVESKSGLSATDIDNDLESLGDGVWETAGFDEARESGDPVWLVSVESGIGAFDLTTY